MLKPDKPAIPVEASLAMPIIQRCLGISVLAVYLHGSAAASGLQAHSDVDLLVVTDQPTAREIRECLVAELMRVSGRYPAAPEDRRPLEVIVFQRDDLVASNYPARSEFVYGEWLREAFENGEVPKPESDPEFTLLLAQARQNARALIGPDPGELLPVVSDDDIRRAIADALPALMDTLEGDERNVLLTLARMWRTLATGEFVPKDAAAEWAISRLPAEPAALVADARAAYLGVKRDDWQSKQRKTRQVALDLRERIAAVL